METSARLNNGSLTQYGGGLLLKPLQGHKMVSHAGGWSSFLMEYRRFPDLGISMLVASNNNFSSPFLIADAICRRILPKMAAPILPSQSAVSLLLPNPNLEGTFLSASNFVRSVQANGTTLSIAIPQSSGKETLLRLDFMEKSDADHTLTFRDERGETVVFQLDSTGQQTLGFWWAGGHYFQVRRFYQKLAAPAVGRSALPFVGKYCSASRKQTLRVRRDRHTGGLTLKPVFFLKYPLEPLGGGAFKVRGEPIVIRFQEDNMIVGNDWANGLRLKKSR